MGRLDHVHWDWIIATKYVAAVGMIVGLGWMWSNRDIVTDPYVNDHTVEALRIEPLTFTAATIPPDSRRSLALAEAPDTGEVALSPLAFVDEAVDPPAVRGGAARISGRVRGLDATDVGVVQLTRITDGGSSSISVSIEDDGSYRAAGLQGGRYRVRALVPGLRASNGSVVIFLGNEGDRTADLSVTTPPQGLVFDVVSTERPILGNRSVVAITVGQQVVDNSGRSVVSPVPNVAVTASFSPIVSLLSESTAITNGGGAARFLVQCDQLGTSSITVTAQDQTAVLTISPCVVEPPPEVEAEDDDG